MRKIFISIIWVGGALIASATENNVKELPEESKDVQGVMENAGEDPYQSVQGDCLKSNAEKNGAKENPTESGGAWKWILIGSAVAAVCYVGYRRSRKTVITFDSVIDYAELAKNSGAATVNAFRLGAMSEIQQKQVMEQYNLGARYRLKGYKVESTLVLLQMDDEGNVLDGTVVCGHEFDEKLSIALSANTVFQINLKS